MSEPHTTSGARLGPYQLGKRIAVGGMAEIFAARRDDQRGWPLVLKVMLPGEGDDSPEFARMFADEGRLAAALDHEHLVRVYEHGVAEGQPYIAMERVDGLSLAQLLRQQRALDPGQALGVAEALLEALEHIHGRTDQRGRALQIVHRDVTPGNVLLSRQGAVKLGDFGIARSNLQQARTRTGVIKGTVQYMAPEQVTNSGVDRRTDLYGVGLLLFEMLAGRPLLQAEREVDLIRLAESPPATPPSSINAAVDGALDRLVAPALAEFPEERYPSAASFLKALRRVRDERGIAAFDAGALGEMVSELAPPAEPEQSPAVADPPPPARATIGGRRLLIAAALMGAVAGTVVLATRGEDVAPVSAADATLASVAADAAAAEPHRDQGPTSGQAGDRQAAPEDARPADGGEPPEASVPDVSNRRVARRRPRARRVDAGPREVPARADGGPGRDRVWEAACEARLNAARAALQARGVRVDDLARATAGRLRDGRLACKAPGQRSRLEALEKALAAIKIDRGFIQRKLGRVDRRLKGLPASRGDRAVLREQAGLALQAFLDGKYDAANQRLNRILGQLARR